MGNDPDGPDAKRRKGGKFIKFAPLVVPRARRLQTLAVFGWTTMLPLSLGFFFILWCVSHITQWRAT